MTEYLSSLQATQNHASSVIASCAAFLLAKTQIPSLRSGSFTFPSKSGLFPLIFHNSLGWEREEFFSIHVASSAVKIFDDSNQELPIQVKFFFSLKPSE